MLKNRRRIVKARQLAESVREERTSHEVVRQHGTLEADEARRVEAEASEAHRDAERASGHPVAGVRDVSREGRRDYAPVGHDPSTTKFATAKRVFAEFQENSLTDQAASLTYYGLLAIFPGLIALVSILGLLGDPAKTTQTLTEVIERLAPGSAAQTFLGPIESITTNRQAAGVAFVVGVVVALFSASGYVGAFSRAANKIYETPEGRPFWKLRPLQLVITLLLVLMLVSVLVGVVLTGPVVDAIAGPIGVQQEAVDVWNVAKWPVMLLMVLVMLGILFYSSPNVRLPRFSLVTPGAMLALALWLVASLGFAFYVANFGSYDKTYGTLGGVITLLVWLWISNLALLLGLQLNAELERNRELDAGIPDAAREIQLDARHEPGRRKTT